MIAKMNCQPLHITKKNKRQIHKAELVHISIMNNNKNNQLLVAVRALMFKKIPKKKIPVYTCVSNELNHFKSINLKNYTCSPIKLQLLKQCLESSLFHGLFLTPKSFKLFFFNQNLESKLSALKVRQKGNSQNVQK